MKIISFDAPRGSLGVLGISHSRITACSHGDKSRKQNSVSEVAGLAARILRDSNRDGVQAAFLHVLLFMSHLEDPRKLFTHRFLESHGLVEGLRRYGHHFVQSYAPELSSRSNDFKDYVSARAKGLSELIVDSLNVQNDVNLDITLRYFTTETEDGTPCLGGGPDGVRVGDEVFYLGGASNPIA